MQKLLYTLKIMASFSVFIVANTLKRSYNAIPHYWNWIFASFGHFSAGHSKMVILRSPLFSKFSYSNLEAAFLGLLDLYLLRI